MTCPSCEQETSCGCKSCDERPHEYERNIMEGNTIKCPYCDFKSSFDIWLDYESVKAKIFELGDEDGFTRSSRRKMAC